MDFHAASVFRRLADDAIAGDDRPSDEAGSRHRARRGSAVSSQDLRHYVRVYDGDLPQALCARMIESFETLSRFQQRNGRGVRAGLEQSAWTELDVARFADAAFLGMFRARIDMALQRYNADVALPLPVPDSPLLSPLVLKRYRAGSGENFQLHFDSIYDVSDRYLVFLWYLNDVDDAGETCFPGLDLCIAPRAGRLLMFPPYWLYSHQGLPSPSADKYILSTYLRFERGQSSV